MKTSALTDASKGTTKPKDGKFLLVADGHKSLLPKDADVAKLTLASFLRDFQKPNQKEWSQTSWLETSTSMLMYT